MSREIENSVTPHNSMRFSMDSRRPFIAMPSASDHPLGPFTYEAYGENNLVRLQNDLFLSSPIEYVELIDAVGEVQGTVMRTRPYFTAQAKELLAEVVGDTSDFLKTSKLVDRISPKLPYIEFGSERTGVSFIVPNEVVVQRIGQKTIETLANGSMTDYTHYLQSQAIAGVSHHIRIGDYDESHISKLYYPIDLTSVSEQARSVLGGYDIFAVFSILSKSSEQMLASIEECADSGKLSREILDSFAKIVVHAEERVVGHNEEPEVFAL